MQASEHILNAIDGTEIFYRRFLPEREITAIVQIFHGMAEHSQRYENFANYLTDNGFAVYISDHRGHGRSTKSYNDYGVWKNKDEWWRLVSDQKQLLDIAKSENPQKPIFVFGHSMGSFLARTFITQYSSELAGVIISGTGTNPNLVLKFGKIVADVACFLCGEASTANLLDKLSFGSYNKGYAAPYQWLSRDYNEIIKYKNDPYCGGVFSNSFYRGFFAGLIYMNDYKNAERISKDLKMQFISGDNDPVGAKGKGVIKAVDFYRELGITNIDTKLYHEARHELLNEINKEEVYEDILSWLKSCL